MPRYRVKVDQLPPDRFGLRRAEELKATGILLKEKGNVWTVLLSTGLSVMANRAMFEEDMERSIGCVLLFSDRTV